MGGWIGVGVEKELENLIQKRDRMQWFLLLLMVLVVVEKRIWRVYLNYFSTSCSSSSTPFWSRPMLFIRAVLLPIERDTEKGDLVSLGVSLFVAFKLHGSVIRE